MAELSFDVLDAFPDRYGTDPTMVFRTRVAETSGDPVHSLMLRVQIQINAQVRSYDNEERALLIDLFGDSERWGETLRPFNWTHAAVMLPGFRGSTEFDIRVPCTYDFDVSAAKYLHGLRNGAVPLDFLYSGTIVSRGATGYSITQVPWHKDSAFALPVRTWRELVDMYWPGGGWIRLRRDTLDELIRYKSTKGITDWDRTLASLMERVP